MSDTWGLAKVVRKVEFKLPHFFGSSRRVSCDSTTVRSDLPGDDARRIALPFPLLASRQFFGSETKKIKLVLFGIASPVSRSLPIMLCN